MPVREIAREPEVVISRGQRERERERDLSARSAAIFIDISIFYKGAIFFLIYDFLCECH